MLKNKLDILIAIILKRGVKFPIRALPITPAKKHRAKRSPRGLERMLRFLQK